MAEFNINAIIYAALSPLCPTVKHIKTDTETYPAITFFQYDYDEEASAENSPVEVAYYIQVDIWAKLESDARRLIPLALSALGCAGFYDPHYQEGYENDAKIYHTWIRVVYIRNLQTS